MLKKTVLTIFLLLLAACSKSSALSQEQVAAVFSGDFACSVSILSGKDVFCADITKNADGMTFLLTCPDSMAGLSAIIDGKNITFDFCGTSAQFPIGALPEKAPAKLFFGAVHTLSLPEKISLGEEQLRAVAYCDGFTAELDKNTFFPEKFSFPAQNTLVEIKNFKIIEKN